MAKYLNPITTKKTDAGKRYYSSAIPAGYTPESIEYQHVARLGDRWDTIAYKYLGNPKFWYVIARANGGVNGSLFIKPGTIITIPEVV
jgi:hypothetical protein